MKEKHLYFILAVIGFFAPTTVGLSFALPLFLYVRESHLEANARTAGGSF